jgi:hypothetical protein
MQQDELFIQTFEEPSANDAVQSAHADVIDGYVVDGLRLLMRQTFQRLETTTSLNKL